MREGLLWFDNDPNRQLSDKISRAVTRYQTRFGRRPTTCYLNERDFDSRLARINGVQLKPVSDVRPNHFWLGVEQDSRAAKAA